MTNSTEPVEMKFQQTAAEVRKAIESHAPLRAEKVAIVRIAQAHNIDTDIETVRVELTYEIKRTA